MYKGITQEEEDIIRKILLPYRKKYDFYLFGSRINGDYRKLSDLDILIRGENVVSVSDFSDIYNAFDNSKLPYTVNLADFHRIEPEFYKTIEKTILYFT